MSKNNEKSPQVDKGGAAIWYVWGQKITREAIFLSVEANFFPENNHIMQYFFHIPTPPPMNIKWPLPYHWLQRFLWTISP